MSHVDWAELAHRLGLEGRDDCAAGRAGRYPAGLTSRGDATWLGVVVGNRGQQQWTLTRRWEPQARTPRRPDATTVKFPARELTERYVGVAQTPEWFRTGLGSTATEALVAAADANRLGACALRLTDHLLVARYRAPADQVPDLVETLAALRALADCLDDPAAPQPDLASTPLLRQVPPTSIVRLDAIEVATERVTCTLPRSGTWSARWRSPSTVIVDWAARQVTVERVTVGLDAVRQVVVGESAAGTTIQVLDVAGAPVFLGRGPLRAAPESTWHGGLEPPLLHMRAVA